jgi:hypothetical protein
VTKISSSESNGTVIGIAEHHKSLNRVSLKHTLLKPNILYVCWLPFPPHLLQIVLTSYIVPKYVHYNATCNHHRPFMSWLHTLPTFIQTKGFGDKLALQAQLCVEIEHNTND